MAIILKHPQVEKDLSEIADFIAEDSIDHAIHFLHILDSKMQMLAENPYAGRSRIELVPDLRSFPYGNYVIFYKPIKNGIKIVRILHSARDISSFLEDQIE